MSILSIAIILMGKRELIAMLNLSSWCLVMVERLFLAMPRGCLQFVIVVFPDHTHLLFIIKHILFYHIWGLQPFWSSGLKQSNEYSSYSNSPVISEKPLFR